MEKSRLLFVSYWKAKDNKIRSQIKMITYDKKTEITLIEGKDPQWSPNGQRIVFAYNLTGGSDPRFGERTDIFLMDTQGNITEQLTNHPAPDYHPDWSPDGKQIAFVSSRNGNNEVYLIHTETKTLKRLTATPELHESFPCWSPDGTRIIYDPTGWGDRIYIMDSNGGNIKDITPAKLLDLVGSSTFSSSGRIAFSGFKRVGGGTAIYTMRADGKDLEQITQETGDIDSSPVFSPDGRMIAYSSGRDIYVVDLIKEEETLYLQASGDEWLYPSSWAWSASAYGVSPEGKIASMWGEIKR